MSARGRRAALPSENHARPEYVSTDGLIVHHYNREGRVRDYDFTRLPVAEPMQRSLAALFAARCVPGRWSTHATSKGYWFNVVQFAEFVSDERNPPLDLDGLTTSLVKRWREHTLRTCGFTTVYQTMSLLKYDPRLRDGDVADELARRIKLPRSRTQSYSEAEFERFTKTAKVMFRAALRRIEGNAGHLQRWHDGEFAEGSPDWLRGEALDHLVRTGTLPHHTGRNGKRQLPRKFRSVVAGKKVPWRFWLFLSRQEATSLGVLLMAEYGWNLAVIDRAEVPQASPDPGPDGHPTYRIPLQKLRRGAGRHHETRNVTDDGASSRGRLITEALRATRFARAIVEDLAPGTNRLIVWRSVDISSRNLTGCDRLANVGHFAFGISGNNAGLWARELGFDGSPFRRGRRTVVALDRREPAQHSQDSHDRQYVLGDKRVQTEAVDVIAAGAEDATNRARSIVLVAELRDAPTAGDQPTATADCADVGTGPYSGADGMCAASFLLCLACANAHIHPGHHPRLAHLHRALFNLRSVLPPATWADSWADAYARLEDLKHTLGEGIWSQVLTCVTDTDRDLINHLLTGDLDT